MLILSAGLLLVILSGCTPAPSTGNTGSGEGYNYTILSSTTIQITGYTGPGGDVIIPSTINEYTVVSIGLEAFQGCTNLTSVNIPSSITSIGPYAFGWCTSLTNVNILSGATSIGQYAFFATDLNTITIPLSITNIGQYAFGQCTNLIGITVTSGNSFYQSDSSGVLFNHDETELIEAPVKLTGSYTIPSTVTNIGVSAFEGCNDLISVNIPSGVISISGFAFQSCCFLTSVNISASVISICNGAFNNCSSLTSVTFASANCSIGFPVFSAVHSGFTIFAPAGGTVQAYCTTWGITFN